LLSPEEFYTMATTGQVDLMIDIRDRSLWRNVGHIPNATHVNNFGRLLASTPTQDINATLRALGIFKCLKSSCVTVGMFTLPFALFFLLAKSLAYLLSLFVFSVLPIGSSRQCHTWIVAQESRLSYLQFIQWGRYHPMGGSWL